VVRHQDFPLHGEILVAQLQYSGSLADCSICFFVPRESPPGIAVGAWPKLKLIEEGDQGGDEASRAFSTYLSTLSAGRSESGPGRPPSGSRLVAAVTKREKRS
jgi:hypothetical protein